MAKFISSLIVLLLSSASSVAYASNPNLIGFDDETRIKILNDFLWYENHLPDSKIIRILSAETGGPKAVDGKGLTRYIANHFPLAISESQQVKTCPVQKDKCQETDFESWPTYNKSVQNLLLKDISLYTPYLDRRFKETVIGFDEQRWLSVVSPNQTIALIDSQKFMAETETSEEYRRWQRLSQWIGLARLHQIFSSNGKAIKSCKSDSDLPYVCEEYDNGSMYFSGVVLLAGSMDCMVCSNRERIALRVSAFDHLIRTGKSEKSEKLVEWMKDDMLKTLKAGGESMRGFVEIYKTRYYQNNWAGSFIPDIK